MNLSIGARSEHPLGLDLAYVAGRALAIGLGVTPDGPAVAYRDALRYLKAVNRDCKGR